MSDIQKPSVPLSTEGRAYPQLEGIYQRLIAMGRLEQNWDHVGAIKIDPSVISNASSLLLFLVNKITPYQINPMPNGRLEMRWFGPKGELILEITHKNRMIYQLMPSEGSGGGCDMSCWSNGQIDTLEELLPLLMLIWVGKIVEPTPKKDSCKTNHRSNLPY
jgi:hypothetical protein